MYALSEKDPICVMLPVCKQSFPHVTNPGTAGKRCTHSIIAVKLS
jgi:hypothetical protein